MCYQAITRALNHDEDAVHHNRYTGMQSFSECLCVSARVCWTGVFLCLCVSASVCWTGVFLPHQVTPAFQQRATESKQKEKLSHLKHGQVELGTKT